MQILTTEQTEAINDTSNLILVKAGAGTGKTEVLARRVLRLLETHQGLSIQDMAIITFTNKATENLISRLKQYLYQKWKNEKKTSQKQWYRYQLEALNGATISTIHSFCKKILDSVGPIFFEDFSYSPSFSISSTALERAVDNTIEQWINNKEKENKRIHHLEIMPVHELKRQVKNAYNMIRSKGLLFENVIDKTKLSLLLEDYDVPRKLKTELIEILTQISTLHSKYKLYSLDTNDLLEYCAKTLTRRKDITESIKKAYKYLFIDEFQDTSAYQTEIIKCICPDDHTGPNLFVVGDAKQSIYKFRGADLNSYSEIEKWIQSQGKVLSLNINFRSTPELIMFVNSTFDRISKEDKKYTFYPEPLKSKAAKQTIDINEAYEWILAPKSSDQPNLLADYLQKQIDTGTNISKYAILFRSNREITEYSKVLNEAKIPYKIIGGGDLYNQQEIIDIYKLINFIIDPSSQVVREEAIATLYFQNDINLFNTFEDVIRKTDISKLTPAQVLDFIYKKLKIKKSAVINLKQANANLNKLKELTRKINFKENLNLDHFKSWLSAMISSHKHESQADIGNDDENNYVTLMTIHKSKGLEFPIVILPELDKQYTQATLRPPIIYDDETGLEIYYRKYYESKNKTRIPSSKYEDAVISLEKEHYSEELRILYVALTRAEKKLILMGSKECPISRICFQNWLLP